MAHLILTYIKQVILLHYILRFLQYYTMTLESTSINGEDAGFELAASASSPPVILHTLSQLLYSKKSVIL